MKWLAFGALVIAFLFVVLSPSSQASLVSAFSQSTCDTPIKYKIGDIDSRFNISQADVQADISQATNVWSSAENKTLFVQDDKADLTVNFVYDQRQALNSQIQQLQQQLDQKNSSIQQQIQAYYAQVASFKQQLNDLNSQIEEWNQKGGAPPDVYNQLKQKQSELQQEAATLNEKAKELNLNTNDYNSQVNVLNQDVNSFNNALSQKPEEGLYDPNNDTITIYFVTNQKELLHTLAHEFGHALGMDHVQDPQAIMYPYTTQTIDPTDDDLNALQNVCKKQLVFMIWRSELQQFIRRNVINKIEKQPSNS